MSRAICVRCGADKGHYERICPACGHRPEGEGLLVAWLLSDAHLDAGGLDKAARRIARGDTIRPSEAMLERARRALGAHASADPGLSGGQRLALLATSLVLTPTVGLTLWAWWRTERPRVALQALWLSLPASVLYAVGVLWLRFGGA
ncbi:MAG: hypothetical protein H6733_01020 [Alphaproteobacteria bacterium]|nr:hypothetical protein [Alphaproteobacteria bacterium]